MKIDKIKEHLGSLIAEGNELKRIVREARVSSEPATCNEEREQRIQKWWVQVRNVVAAVGKDNEYYGMLPTRRFCSRDEICHVTGTLEAALDDIENDMVVFPS